MTRSFALIVILTATVSPALAADGSDACPDGEEAIGEAAFKAFDAELRSALSTEDTTSLALLVKFPVLVNFSNGSKIAVSNPFTLQLRFQEVFPKYFRAKVIAAKHEAPRPSCRNDSVSYDDRGKVWLEVVGRGKATHFAITAVNVPSQDETAGSSPPAPGVVFTCNTSKHRIIVDISKDGSLRYRSWNRPRSFVDKPDMQVLGGKDEMEGTGPCAHSFWTFNQGKTSFVVSESGCSSSEDPDDATGSLEVLVDGKQKMEAWCFH